MITKITARSAWSRLRQNWLNLRRLRFWFIAIALLYMIVGFIVVPWAVHSYAQSTLKQDLGRDLRIGNIYTNPFTLDLEVEELALHDIDGRDLVVFDRLFVNVNWASLYEWTPVISRLRLEGLSVHEERFDSGQTRLTRLLSEVQNRPLPRAGPGGSIIRPVQSGPTMPVKFKDADILLEDFILADDAVTPFQISGQFKPAGAFRFDGKFQLRPALEVNGKLDIDNLALAIAEPFVRHFARVDIKSGSLSAKGRVRSGPGEPLAYAGSARIASLDIGERNGGADVLGWQALRIENVDFRLGARVLKLSLIRIDKPSARVFIAEDRSTNLGDLLVEQPEAPATEPDAPDTPFDIVIDGIRLNDGRLAFTDRSLPLPFSTRVKKLEGGISKLSRGLEEPARIDLEGEVADYGQTRINGELYPWDPLNRAQADVIFENLNMPELSPYVIQFAGRRVAAGRMDLDLGYKLDAGQLVASNRIVLRDLKLGERFDHPDAIELPLGLAIALLKDSEGVISVDVPVTGDLRNPEFSFGPAIRQALSNLLTGIISSPFNLLAGLVDGAAEDLAQVTFAPGSSEIRPQQRQHLDQLRDALNKRPELALELPAPYAPDTDRPALQKKRALDAMVKRLDKAGIEVANPSLTAAETSDTLKAMFRDRYPQRSLTKVRKRFTIKREDAAPAFDTDGYYDYLAGEVVAAQPVTEKDLKALGQARAEAVRKFLLSEGEGEAPAIKPDRVRLQAPEEVGAEGADPVPLELGVATE